jgi:2OG-Fe(II) oxygenase superfamily
MAEKSTCDPWWSNPAIVQLGIHSRFYKLLFYETGGHFTAHRDTEKEAGMFGTLIIQLPSKFSGGAFTVSHQGETKTFVQDGDSEKNSKYIAFFSDCEHQLHPVTSGVRLCLVFNLICAAPKTPTHAISIDTETRLQSMARDWIKDKGSCSELGYGLGHQYTPQSFGVEFLKGRDAVVFRTLLNAKSMNGKLLFEIQLLLMERYCHDDQDVLTARLLHTREGVKRKCYRLCCKDASGWYVTYRDNCWARIMARIMTMFAAKRDNKDIKDYRVSLGFGYEDGYAPPVATKRDFTKHQHDEHGYEDGYAPSVATKPWMVGGAERSYYAAAIVISPSKKAIHS